MKRVETKFFWTLFWPQMILAKFSRSLSRSEIFEEKVSYGAYASDKITEEDKLRKDKTLFVHWTYN